MSAHLTVYCRTAVGTISPAALLAAIKAADLYTIAEGFGIDDEDFVDAAEAMLRVERLSESAFQLCYRDPGLRQVAIEARPVVDMAELAEPARESLEAGDALNQVLAHLAATVEVFDIELGWQQLDDMGIVVANQASEYLASIGDGLIRDQNRD
jgi:hypothetical protein